MLSILCVLGSTSCPKEARTLNPIRSGRAWILSGQIVWIIAISLPTQSAIFDATVTTASQMLDGLECNLCPPSKKSDGQTYMRDMRIKRPMWFFTTSKSPKKVARLHRRPNADSSLPFLFWGKRNQQPLVVSKKSLKPPPPIETFQLRLYLPCN